MHVTSSHAFRVMLSLNNAAERLQLEVAEQATKVGNMQVDLNNLRVTYQIVSANQAAGNVSKLDEIRLRRELEGATRDYVHAVERLRHAQAQLQAAKLAPVASMSSLSFPVSS